MSTFKTFAAGCIRREAALLANARLGLVPTRQQDAGRRYINRLRLPFLVIALRTIGAFQSSKVGLPSNEILSIAPQGPPR